MKIPLSAPDVTELEIEAVAATLRSSQLSLGPRLIEFEAAFTQLTGVEHAIAVSSGTAGLHLVMLALGIQKGDEIIVPSFTFIAAANAIRYVGATPIFVDIDPITLNLSPDAVEKAITSRARAILAVHTFGVPADMSALVSLAQRHNLTLIEDACEALGSTINSKPIGSFGEIAVFAFYPNKQVTTGEGGMIVTRNARLAAHMRSLRNQGRTSSDSWLQHTELGYNYRLSEIACTLGIGQMQRLASILDRREEISHLYHQQLASVAGLTLPIMEILGARISWFVYVVRLTDVFTTAHRDQVIHHLEQAGIGCGRYFAPIHLQRAYADLPPGTPLPVTEFVASRTIALPFLIASMIQRLSPFAKPSKRPYGVYLKHMMRSNQQRPTRESMSPFLNRYNITTRATQLLSVWLLVLSSTCVTVLHAEQQHSSEIEAARLNNLGTALMGQQFLDRAADTFAAAVKTDPNLTLAKVNEGIALLYLQRLPEAEQLLNAAAAANPKDPHVWYAFGLLYRNQNHPEQALAAFQKVVALKPSDPDTHYMLASIYLELNNLPAATAAYRKTLELDPHHASAIFGLARVLRREGDLADAQQALARFQHISSAKLGFPLSHNYGEEGLYAHVEDAALAPTRVGPMIPVTFTESWRTQPFASSAKKIPGAACLIDLSANDEPALVVMSTGEDAVHIYDRIGPTRFVELPAIQTGIHIPGTGLACAVGDYDNDGLPDLALAISSPDGQDRILLYRNLGNGKFEDVTATSGILPTNHPTSLTFVDYDHDGDLDLFITGTPSHSYPSPNTLWRNNGNKTFTNWTKPTSLEGTTPTTAAILSDLNNDRAVDLLVASNTSAPTFFANHREGPFGSSPLFSASLPPTVSVTTLDFNKDGWMDVLLSHAGPPGVTLWRNVDGKNFERVPLPLAGVLSAAAAIPIDFDNDSWIDIAALVETRRGPELRILRNLGPAGFADVSAQLKLSDIHLRSPRSLIAADVDHTGASDLIVTEADGSTILLTNNGGNRNHSLHILLHGVADNKSGIGTKIQVFANGLWQKWEDTGQPEIIAGLGSADKADLVRLLWPTGVPQDEIDVVSTGIHPITELDRRGSSCPTLFAWNGHGYNFVADVIGAAVIGHWVSPTKHNIPDPDEWIKVSGDQLHERNGLFSLRFGEPMEEVNFVDQVRLVAIDHPSGTAVFPNEGFLSKPPFAKAKTIVTAAAQPLTGAWDDHGNNVLPILSQRDINNRDTRTYVRDFMNLPFAGFANLHSLTINIGPWSPQRPLRLLLHGFIEYFSASSMYSAWQAGLSPIPPFIEAQMPDGSWRKVVADMGFPAGLPRTVTVDLTGKLPAGATRLRITTNLQIYWDQALVDNEPTLQQQPSDAALDTRTTELSLSHATLAFRGYPQQLDGRTPGDLTYNYQRMSATGPFVPHRGAYTRYGDVTPLLHSIDDEFVIFGTGEDMDLEFSDAALPALPSGWSRDYFFYANGFVKDMDFYEAKPFNVGALPFHGMSTYPYPSTEHYPTDAAHTAYQLEYNTRFESGAVDRSFQFDYVPRASTPDTHQ